MVTNSATNTATGASGTVLQGAGVGTHPAFSTATYPATATGTGTILRADGTNWSATTATYPTTTTAFQLLVSTATSVIGGLTVGATGTVLTGVTGAVPAFSATPTVTSITFGAGNALASYVEGTFTPTLFGASTAGTTTYVGGHQTGFYIRVGNLVQIQVDIRGNSANGTGFTTLGGFPFTIKNQSNGTVIGPIFSTSDASWAWYAAATTITCVGLSNTVTALIGGNGAVAVSGFFSMGTTDFYYTFGLMYEI